MLEIHLTNRRIGFGVRFHWPCRPIFDLVMSKQWSCETLRVGYEDVMCEALKRDETALLTEIQDRETENRVPLWIYPIGAIKVHRSNIKLVLMYCGG